MPTRTVSWKCSVPSVSRSPASRLPLVLPSPSMRSPSLQVSVSLRSVHSKMISPCRFQHSASVSLRRFLVRERWESKYRMPNPVWCRWNRSSTPRSSRRPRWNCLVRWVRPSPTRCSCSTWPKHLTSSWLVPQVRVSLSV